ncbi:hypothetical protein UPYG_G00318070 [Umbra pygmaea]|uniref:Uncharacterized protein n=1 Tax=Umbra pygmaea TaxID=75934 RepID=A0ABD0W132_UMBPY
MKTITVLYARKCHVGQGSYSGRSISRKEVIGVAKVGTLLHRVDGVWLQQIPSQESDAVRPHTSSDRCTCLCRFLEEAPQCWSSSKAVLLPMSKRTKQ